MLAVLSSRGRSGIGLQEEGRQVGCEEGDGIAKTVAERAAVEGSTGRRGGGSEGDGRSTAAAIGFR